MRLEDMLARGTKVNKFAGKAVPKDPKLFFRNVVGEIAKGNYRGALTKYSGYEELAVRATIQAFRDISRGLPVDWILTRSLLGSSYIEFIEAFEEITGYRRADLGGLQKRAEDILGRVEAGSPGRDSRVAELAGMFYAGAGSYAERQEILLAIATELNFLGSISPLSRREKFLLDLVAGELTEGMEPEVELRIIGLSGRTLRTLEDFATDWTGPAPPIPWSMYWDLLEAYDWAGYDKRKLDILWEISRQSQEHLALLSRWLDYGWGLQHPETYPQGPPPRPKRPDAFLRPEDFRR